MAKNDFFKLPEKIFGLEVSFLKLFVVPFLLLLAFIIGFNLVIVPKFSDLAKLNESIGSINKEIDLTTQKINYLSSVDQQQLEDDAEYLESAVLQNKNSYMVVGVIKKVADKYGFAVSSFSTRSIQLKEGDQKTLKVADKDVATKIPLDVTLVGPDLQRVGLIMALEKTLPILFVDNLDMSSSNGVATLKLAISSYYIADNSMSVSGNLSLNDLIPTQEENDLLKTISSFDEVDFASTEEVSEKSQFVKYDRPNPFTL